MKILIGMPSPDSWGGPIACEPPFVEALRGFGIDVTEEIYVYGDKDRPTPIFERIKRVCSTAFRFRKLLKKQDFDIIHFNTAFDLKTILRDSFTLFVVQPKAKIFFKFHGSEAEKFADANFLVKILINYLANKVDGFGILSSEEKVNFVQLGFAESKFYQVKNAIVQNSTNEFIRIYKNADEIFNLIFVARFITTKGLLETIRACQIVKDKEFKILLNCLGDGEIRRLAEIDIEKLGLQNVVNLTGYVSESEVSQYLLTSDIFVFPTSHAEGFPMVLFKSAAVGLPIITTKSRAAADYFIEKENCLFCTNDPQNIADKIIELIENKELRQTISEHNRQFGERLLPESIAREYIEIYENLLDS